MKTLTQTQKILIGVITAVIIILAFAVFAQRNTDGAVKVSCEAQTPEVTGASAYFAQIFRDKTFEITGARPIEGYEPSMLLDAHGHLQPSDFECVQAMQGYYTVKGNEVEFVSLVEREFEHTAARAITDAGMGQLLENIARRMNVPFETPNQIESIIQDVR